MDSFFSLFDPSEDCHNKSHKNNQEQDNVKKKNDPPKGRKRGRKNRNKHETLPEESSFLCEPNISSEMLVKDRSYIESFIEVKLSEDAKKDDKKPKRRNSGRKNRRKKNKVSPAKELSSTSDWKYDTADTNLPEKTNWNNQLPITKICDDKIGKNVNDLKIKNNRDVNADRDMFKEHGGYNVIDKLEKVSLKDDMYMAGDFNTDDLDNDLFYSSDEFEEPYDDTVEESAQLAGRLPPEPRFGNVEYKLQLVAPSEKRFQHLVTQLKWRLRSGGGGCVYVVGVRDCGALVGLTPRALRASLRTLRRMAAALQATLHHATARRVAPHRAVAEVYIRKLANTQQSVELRVAVMGANEAGKSTLIGVLTQGELDNGRGSARLNMFRHLHEVKSGRTSSLSHEILGFDAQGNVVNYGCSELMTAERIGERSAKLVSFLDLAGHTKYQRTTLHGLSGYAPHYAMLLISATGGITRITEEHLALLAALDLPFCVVITKCELAPAASAALLARLALLLQPLNKKPLLITDENLARNCVGPQKLILDSIDKGVDSDKEESPKHDVSNVSNVPVFPVSCVRGVGLNSLHALLLALHPAPPSSHRQDETCEFQIDEIFHVGDSAGPVVGGLLARGQLYEGDNLIIGPLESGEFVDIGVATIYRNRVPCGSVLAGQSASLGLRGCPPALRPGMVLLSRPPDRSTRNIPRPSFGGCPPGRCRRTLDVNHNENRKHVRRKNEHLLQLTKEVINPENIYNGDSDTDDEWRETEECTCGDRVLLEDPDDPRGCIYFQAWVQVLRHSTAICPGFQCTVHVANVRQTAIIQGIMSRNGCLRAHSAGSVVFRFTRCPEYVVRGRRLLLTAGLGTRAIGRVTQIFPHVP